MRISIVLVSLGVACSSTDPAAPLPDPLDPAESVAVQTSCPAPAPVSSTSVRVVNDVVYTTPDGQSQRLDIARPAAGGVRPLVVLIHGGSWSFGSKTGLRADMFDLAGRGYVAATIDYRLTSSPTNLFPAAVRDVRCAVRWLRSQQGAYGIDTANIAAAGFSAGGHLAAMLGVNPADPRLDGDCAVGGDASVDAVISYAGPQDLRVNGPYTEQQAAIVTNFLGAFPGDVPELAALASPITAVSADDPPFLLIHGARDELVPPSQSQRMLTALREVGGKATLLTLADLSHSYAGVTASHRGDVRCTSVAFLKRWLGN